MRSTEIRARDIDDALARLEAVLRPRVGRRMTRVVLDNMVRLREAGAEPAQVLGAIHASLDAYARIPESGTPFSLADAKAIGDAGAPKLSGLLGRHDLRRFALAMGDEEALSVAQHADALLPAYGADDAEFAARVAWQNAHLYRLHLDVGRAFNRNDAGPAFRLFAAWQRQGAPGDGRVPIAAVDAAVGTPGVIYALGAPPTVDVRERFAARGFVFSPDSGDAIDLGTWDGTRAFLRRVPLVPRPSTLAWLVHLLRMTEPGAPFDVEDELLSTWEKLEEQPGPGAAGVLLGLTPTAEPERAQVRIRVGATTFVVGPGELHVAVGGEAP